MKRSRVLSVVVFLFFCLGAKAAHTVRLDFKMLPQKPVFLMLKKGTGNDTISTTVSDKDGKATLTIPDQYDSFAGMATVRVGNEIIDFIINGENPVIRSSEEGLHGGNVIFEQSEENKSLQEWFMEQAIRREKIGRLRELENIYKKEESFYKQIEKEKQGLEKAQADFEKMVEKSPLYTAKFMRFYDFLNQDIASLYFAPAEQRLQIRNYVRDSLDVNALYTSGLWFNILNGLLPLYDEGSVFHKDFISDMSLLLERAQSDEIYVTLAENLFMICESTGWKDQEKELAAFIIKDSRIQEPSHRMKSRMDLYD